MATFPGKNKLGDAFYPSSRSLTPGEYPVKTYRALSGKTVRRSFGSRPSNFIMELEFANVPEATVQTIVEHYNGQYGTTVGFALPLSLFRGYSKETRDLFIAPKSTLWYYSEAPQIQSIVGEYSTVAITLVAEIV